MASYATAASKPILSFNPLVAHRRLFKSLPLPDSKDNSGLFDRLGVEVVATSSGSGTITTAAFRDAFTYVIDFIARQHCDAVVVHEDVVVVPGGASASGRLLLALHSDTASEHHSATEFALQLALHFTAEGVPCGEAFPSGFSIACRPAFELVNSGWSKIVVEHVPFSCFRKGLVHTILRACPHYQHLHVAGEFAGASDLRGNTARHIMKSTIVAFIVAPPADRKLVHLPRTLRCWDGAEVTLRVSFEGSAPPAVPPPPPRPPPLARSTAPLHSTAMVGVGGTALPNASSPMEDVQPTGPTPMAVDGACVSGEIVQVPQTIRAAPSFESNVLPEVEAVSQEDEVCHLWLQDNGLAEEGDYEITDDMRQKAIARVRMLHPHALHTITGNVPPAPVREMLQDALQQVFDECLTPVSSLGRPSTRRPPPPATQGTARTTRTPARASSASLHGASGQGQGPNHARLGQGRVKGPPRDAGPSKPRSHTVRSLSPLRPPRLAEAAPYVSLRGRVCKPVNANPAFLGRGAPG